MNKREVMLSLLDSTTQTPYIPAGFFLHFDPDCHRGQAAIDKHLEFFQFTGMDFVKIQYETSFPRIPEIEKPEDWSKMPLYNQDFYQDQWDLAQGLVKAAGKESMVLMTLYSPFMCAGSTAGRDVLVGQIRQNPEKVKVGMEIITESLMIFVKGCIERGIDGFYHSTQGGEADQFGGSPLFDQCIKPYDLALMEEIDQQCEFNILHICDYHSGYNDLSPFLDYPGDVVNCSLESTPGGLSSKEASQMFGRPFMGGMNRKGIIVSGKKTDIECAVKEVLMDAPNKFILGADCTLPSSIDWENIRTAISFAHQYTW